MVLSAYTARARIHVINPADNDDMFILFICMLGEERERSSRGRSAAAAAAFLWWRAHVFLYISLFPTICCVATSTSPPPPRSFSLRILVSAALCSRSERISSSSSGIYVSPRCMDWKLLLLSSIYISIYILRVLCVYL